MSDIVNNVVQRVRSGAFSSLVSKSNYIVRRFPKDKEEVLALVYISLMKSNKEGGVKKKCSKKKRKVRKKIS